MNIDIKINRRTFSKGVAVAAAGALMPAWACTSDATKPGSKIKIGLVTYLWGKDMDVPTLIASCTKSGISGIELRVEHAHGVNPGMSASERAAVKKQFEDSQVTFVGMGTNEQFDSPDPAVLKQNIDRAKEFIRLSADLGGTGVKVKPNGFHESVPHEQTIEQIGKALNELGEYGSGFGQKIRLEVHGKETQELPNIKAIMDVANHSNVGACWNSNDEDLLGQGLDYNFNLVKDRLADTVHVRELNIGEYPYQQLMNLFVAMDYEGWILLECRTDPEDKVAAMTEQVAVFQEMIKKGQEKLS